MQLLHIIFVLCFSNYLSLSASSLYQDYVTQHLKKISKRENKCYSNRNKFGPNIVIKQEIPCEQLTEDRVRKATAFAYHIPKDRDVMETNVATYKAIGVPALIEKMQPQTIMGEASLTVQVCSPSTIRNRIKHVQRKQQFFEQNQTIQEACDVVLKAAKSGEQALLNLWNIQHCAETNRILEPYAGTMLMEPFKKNITARNIELFASTSKNLLWPLGISYLMLPAIERTMRNTQYEKYYKNLELAEAMSLYMMIPFLRSIYGVIMRDKIQIGLGLSGAASFVILIKMGYPPKTKSEMNGGTYSPVERAFNSVPFFTFSIDVVRACNALYENRISEKETALHQSLIDIANYIRSAEDIYVAMQKNPAFKEAFPQFCDAYEGLCTHEHTKQCIDTLLTTETFKGSPSAFSNVGRISLVSEQLMATKEAIIPLMKAMGELDAYSALVHFKKNHKNAIPFIYTDPQEKKEAYIIADALVHPAQEESKPNSITFNNDTTVITGPNGCGKSFSSKTAAINIISSQVFGFAQAKKFNHSLVHELSYEANISDKVGVKSGYQAELASISNIYGCNMQTAHNNQVGFYILDEPCKATNAKAGAAGVEEYIKRVDAIPNNNNMRIIITHHDIKDMPNVRHYQVNDDGTFILIPGRSKYSNALKLLLQEFDKKEKEFAQTLLDHVYQ